MFAKGLVSDVTAIMCFEGFNPASVKKSFTSSSFASVSCVVPDLDTKINSVRDKSFTHEVSTWEASSGSTFEIKYASAFFVPCAFAHSSNARYNARGPKSEPPMPICTTVVKVSPFSLVIFPE